MNEYIPGTADPDSMTLDEIELEYDSLPREGLEMETWRLVNSRRKELSASYNSRAKLPDDSRAGQRVMRVLG